MFVLFGGHIMQARQVGTWHLLDHSSPFLIEKN